MSASLKLDSRSKRRERYGTFKTRSPYLLAEADANWSAVNTITAGASNIKTSARWHLREAQKAGQNQSGQSQSQSQSTSGDQDLPATEGNILPVGRARSVTVSGAEGYHAFTLTGTEGNHYRSRLRDNTHTVTRGSVDAQAIRSRKLSADVASSRRDEVFRTAPIPGTRFSVQPARLDLRPIGVSPSALQPVIERPRRASLQANGERLLTVDTESETETAEFLPSSVAVMLNVAASDATADSDVSAIQAKSAPNSPNEPKLQLATHKQRSVSNQDAQPTSSQKESKTNKSRWRSLVDAVRRRRSSTPPNSDKMERRAEKKEKRKKSTGKAANVPAPNPHLAAFKMQTGLGTPLTVSFSSDTRESNATGSSHTWSNRPHPRPRDALRLLDTIADGDSHSDFAALALELTDNERSSTPTISLHEDALQALDVEASTVGPLPVPRKSTIPVNNTSTSMRRHRESDSETERVPQNLALRLIDDVASIEEAALIGMFKTPGTSSAASGESDLSHLRIDYLPLAGGNWFRVINEETHTEKLFITRDPAMLQLPFIRRNHLVDRNRSYALFLKAHKCHHLVPTRTKIVAFDIQLAVRKAFFALVSNGVRAAPLWDSTLRRFVGMLTVTDFIRMLKKLQGSGRLAEIEEHRIATWREQLNDSLSTTALVSIDCEASLFDAVRTLASHHVHRLPVVERARCSILYILTYRRILKFLHCYMRQLTMPDFMRKTLGELHIGTFDVAVAHRDTLLIDVLNMMEDRAISAVPVVDDQERLIDIYSKFDVLNLAAEKTYDDLNVTVSAALHYRREFFEGVVTCRLDESLSVIIDRLVEKHVHRLVIVERDASSRDSVSLRVKGILSLSDILHFIVLEQDTA